MDFITLTIELLKFLSNIAGGNFAVGIILLTVIVRAAMWSLSFSQQKSMREMQRFQPEMKRIQDRYKSDPQLMQQKMMEFYQKHHFNPMAGCLPLLIQMPVFILLYSALISPQFISVAGDTHFLFIQRLDTTLRGRTGVSNDGSFLVGRKDSFTINKNKINEVYLSDGEKFENVKTKSKGTIEIMGSIEPGEPVDIVISLDSLDLKFSQLAKVKSAKVEVSDASTREVEQVEFTRDGDVLKASVPTVASKTGLNIDVLMLVILFGLTMFFSQKIMMAKQKNQEIDPQQAAMQKMMGFIMPVMLTGTFVIIPIPAGVLLYLVVSNIFQVIQTVIINKQLDIMETEKSKNNDSNDGLKKVEAKKVKDVDNSDN